MDDTIQELHQEGTRLFEEGKYSQAEPLLKEVIMKNPNYADVLNKLGVISHLRDEVAQARDYFQKAVQINPGYTEASLNLAVALNHLGEFDQAKEVFSLAAQAAAPVPSAIDPFAAGKLANEHFKIGNIYLDLAMYEDAVVEYRKAIKLQSRFPDVHTKLGIALRSMGKIEEAIIHFNTAKELNRDYGPAWIQLGLTYYIKGLSGMAFEEWENALIHNPDLKQAMTYLKLLKKDL
ncbi:lipoprotein NlpI [bacterium BMS3Abin07]|nr:lipoprotein NlpI [bacterium BMS3Abin07]GBE32782.1 lipoprotein NlpI [bacterium BMS3Bbin05]HDO21565.1 tetratricopeptide repeat protein [Nitrospirota bacterium]HDZ87237.1 tetratricopeptide repeat protein [Nitrospirota bacterium]